MSERKTATPDYCGVAGTNFRMTKVRLRAQITPIPIEIGKTETRFSGDPHPSAIARIGNVEPRMAPITED